MSLQSLIIQGALSAVGAVFPAAAPAIAIATKLEPYAEVAFPLVKAALTQGPAAWAAAQKAAPDFFAHLTDLATQLKGASTGSDQPADDIEVAQLASHIIGVDPPGWAHADTQRWWDAQGAGTQS